VVSVGKANVTAIAAKTSAFVFKKQDTWLM